MTRLGAGAGDLHRGGAGLLILQGLAETSVNGGRYGGRSGGR